MIRLKRLGISVMAGSAVTALPWLLSKVDALWPLYLLTYPGAFVAWEVSGDIYHYSRTILALANVAIYTLFVYGCWALRSEK